MKPGNKVLLAASLAQLVYSIIILYALLTPLYKLTGIVEGNVSIGWYTLSFYNIRIHIPALDTLHIIIFPVYVHAIYTLMASIAGLLLCKGKLEEYRRPIEESLYANALVATSFTGLLIKTAQITSREVSQLATDYTSTTSAGTIILGKATLHANQALESLLKPLPIIAMTTVVLITSTYYILNNLKRHDRG